MLAFNRLVHSPGDKIELDTSDSPKGLGSWASLDGLFD